MRRHITAAECRDIAGRGAEPYAPAAGEGTRAGLGSLLKFLEFLLGRVGLQREESVFDHDLLPFFAIDEFDELSNDRIQGFIGLLVDIEIEVTPERIGPLHF